MRECIICNQVKNESEFETTRKKCKTCRSRERNQREKSTDPIMYYCKRMAYDAHSRIFAPSRSYKKCYRNLTEPFGFENAKELQRYLYDNFYNEIEQLLNNKEIPSIDRIDTTFGYTKSNIRVISFKQNTLLGVNERKRKVKTVTPNNEIIYFNSVKECAIHFGITENNRTNKVSSWIKNDKKYKRPEGYSFEYIS